MKHTIEVVKIEACSTSDFIKPQSFYYKHNGQEKRWDLVAAHDSVAVLLYHEEKDAFVLVKQFRPSIYIKNDDGFTYELCAGIVDKNKSLEEIIKDEISEETGHDAPLEIIEKVASFYTAVGFAGSHQTLYFAKIDDSMKIGEGGGVDNENIEVVYLPRSEALDFINNPKVATTSGLMFAMMWYFKTFNQ